MSGSRSPRLEHLQDRLPPFISDIEARARSPALSESRWNAFLPASRRHAAASIAQVHRAQTSDTPPVRVAVKVLRPRCAAIRREPGSAGLLCPPCRTLLGRARRLRFTAVVATLAESVALELDLRMEAAAAGELYERTREKRNFACRISMEPHLRQRR